MTSAKVVVLNGVGSAGKSSVAKALQQITQLNEQAQRGAVDARFNYANALITLEERLGGAVGG